MRAEIYEKISKNEDFIKLVKKRRNFTWSLTFIICFVYFSFILSIAFFPSFLSIRLANTNITLGMPFAIFVIFLCFLLTGVYAKKANDEFDNLNEKIKNAINNEKSGEKE